MIYTNHSIMSVCRQLSAVGQKIVLVTGFFDLLHQEHINFLVKAKQAGDILIVAVESDARARALKGEGRPVETQTTRLARLTPFADYLIALDKNFNNPQAFESLIATVRPSVLAVSSHTAHQDKKQALVEKYGGKLVVVHQHNPRVSTSIKIDQNKV